MSEGPKDPNAPSFEMLKKLSGMLPSMVQGIKEKRIGGKGTPVVSKKPRQVCGVCGRLFDYVAGLGEETAMITGTCEPCESQFKEGFAAYWCRGEVLFLKHPNLADRAGKVTRIGPVLFAMIKDKFASTQNPPPKPEQPEPPKPDE